MKTMTEKINRQAAFLVVPASIAVFFFTEWRFALSVLIGGLIGLVNFRGIVWSVNALLGTEKAQSKMVFLSFFRLLIIFSLLVILAVFEVIRAYGLLVGFTIVFIIIIKEGLLKARSEIKKENREED